MNNDWQDIKTAPKPPEDDPYKEVWILGVTATGEQRVMRWCTEYPYTEGTWMFAYEPTDYIDGIQSITPVAWQPLPPFDKDAWSKK